MGGLLNRANRKLAQSTVRALDIGPGSTVLEIGFGGGNGISAVLSLADTITIHGIDISPVMLQLVRNVFRQEIAEGRVQVQLADVAKLPFGDAMFDRVFAVNNI